MVKMIRPGEFDKYLDIQVNTTDRDLVGGITNSWATFANVWASVKPLQGFEASGSDQTKARVRYLMTYPWQTGITASMRVVWDSRTFNIEAPINRNEHDALILMNVVEIDAS